MHRLTISSRLTAAAVFIAAAALCTTTSTTSGGGGGGSGSEIIYETEDPFGGFFGIIGFDISTHQSVATRFTPQGDYTLDRVRPWFMNNSGSMFPSVTLTLRNDLVIDGQSFPGDEILESWTFNLSTLGWNPVQENLESVLNPLLEQGENYWLQADSGAIGGANPVWNWAQPGNGWMSICNSHPADPPGTCEWSPASTSAVVAVTVEGTPAEPKCVPPDLNCDGSVGVVDLLILLGAWGDCANCDDCSADLTGDCNVGVADLLILLANWG